MLLKLGNKVRDLKSLYRVEIMKHKSNPNARFYYTSEIERLALVSSGVLKISSQKELKKSGKASPAPAKVDPPAQKVEAPKVEAPKDQPKEQEKKQETKESK
jgi:hypothetical protein